MTTRERFEGVFGYFRKNVPIAEPELHFRNPYELICAVVLSAQCTDKRVNMVTPKLFEAYPDCHALAKAKREDVLKIISSISYPNSKADHLIGLGQRLASEFGGEVPSDIDQLMSLPGVGRKTANVVASIVYNKPVIAVDTHVFRLSHRLGLSKGTTPLAVERDLERYVPESERPIAHHWLILHGRYVCKAVKPLCGECQLKQWCKNATR